MKIVEYVKAHPYATGAIVIIGGVVFFMLSGFGRGGSSSANPSNATDPQIAAMAMQDAENQAQLAAQGQVLAVEQQKNTQNFELGKKALDTQQFTNYDDELSQVAQSYLDTRAGVQIGAFENPRTLTQNTQAGGGFSFLGFSFGADRGQTTTQQATPTFSWPTIDEVLGSYQRYSSLGQGNQPQGQV